MKLDKIWKISVQRIYSDVAFHVYPTLSNFSHEMTWEMAAILFSYNQEATSLEIRMPKALKNHLHLIVLVQSVLIYFALDTT